MARTTSGDYALPSPGTARLMNAALAAAPLVPAPIKSWYLKRHRYYQGVDPAATGGEQGQSLRKWEALPVPKDLTGKSVLDIGCAEGFFSLQSARNGARHVVGVDSRFKTLLCGRFFATRERLPIEFRVGVFPDLGVQGPFDCVLCLSVLHHLVSTKDIWKVLSDPARAADRTALQAHLRTLRRLTALHGRCIIEMPYEYEDEQSRAAVDFDRFAGEVVQAGFSGATTHGTWDHAADKRDRKDRIIYAADA